MECEDDNGSISVLKGGIVWRFFFFNLGPKECRRIELVSVLLECSKGHVTRHYKPQNLKMRAATPRSMHPKQKL